MERQADRTTPRTGSPPDHVRFYFSYRSPFAWLATRRIPTVLGDCPIPIRLYPVWEPEPELRTRLAERNLVWSFSAPSREKRRYYFHDVRRWVRYLEVPFRWPVDRNPRWSLPHLGLLHAREHGLEWAYHRTVFDRRFTRGEEVLSVDAVGRVLETLDLSAERFLERVAEGVFDEAVMRCFASAAADDVFGWPFFVYGHDRFWGNDRLEWLAAAVQREHGRARSRTGVRMHG